MKSTASASLLWIPVGAGTHFQRFSLLLYEWLAARLARRPRARLVHAGLKLDDGARRFTVELMPAPRGRTGAGEVSGPVALPWLGRLRWFRYQVCVLEVDALPDEHWALGRPLQLTADPAVVARMLCLAKQVPAYTWGRRAPGGSEMWTSDSAVSWLLLKAGLELDGAGPPPGCMAPGWAAGIAEARRAG